MSEQKTIMREISLEEEIAIIPCQLKKVSARPCNLMCAFENCCPVYFVDSNEVPIFRRLTKEDLEVRSK